MSYMYVINSSHSILVQWLRLRDCTQNKINLQMCIIRSSLWTPGIIHVLVLYRIAGNFRGYKEIPLFKFVGINVRGTCLIRENHEHLYPRKLLAIRYYYTLYRTLAKISPSWINAHPLFCFEVLARVFSLEYTPTQKMKSLSMRSS